MFERQDDIHGLHRIVEANGGGAALFDFDRDDQLDIYMTNGCRLPLQNDDHSTPGELFLNRGTLRFERVTAGSGLVQVGYGAGCTVGDLDGDGFDDLYITAFGPNALWHNNGDGTFSDITAATGTAAPAWSSSAAFADVNSDGFLDLYVANYLDESDTSPRSCPNPASPDGVEQCPPAMYQGVDDALFISDGAGGFIDATQAAGIAGTRGKGLGVVISDFDGDGRPEIYVANDGEANFLFVAGGDRESHNGVAVPKYRDLALPSGVALSEAGYAQASMGIAAGDYDGNGTTDLFLTNFFADSNILYSNRGGLTFDDVTRASNLAASSRDKLGFGTVFFDADNDGWLDLFVANGHIDDRTWMAHGEPYRMRPLLYRNGGTTVFEDVSARGGEYFVREWLGRGVASGDLDRDGLTDLVVSHQRAPSAALRNETPEAGAAVVLQLVGTRSNRNSFGAVVEVEEGPMKLVREVVGGGSFQSASALEVHLGLGNQPSAFVQIRWPSGESTRQELAAGRWIAREGRTIVPDGSPEPLLENR
ncbi:MAG TPA: CRTAC1 family protein [Planctomycetaceae bacterium]|nr:CRTAC1 family protein [Planctomycetaceae bacterium]